MFDALRALARAMWEGLLVAGLIGLMLAAYTLAAWLDGGN